MHDPALAEAPRAETSRLSKLRLSITLPLRGRKCAVRDPRAAPPLGRETRETPQNYPHSARIPHSHWTTQIQGNAGSRSRRSLRRKQTELAGNSKRNADSRLAVFLSGASICCRVLTPSGPLIPLKTAF